MGVLDIIQFLKAWQAVPAWGIFILLLMTMIKTFPIVQKNLLDAREKRESRYGGRIRELEDAVRACQLECEQHKEELRREIREMHDQLLGQRRQHVQEQISLVNAIVSSVDNPLLKSLLKSLESVQRTLPAEERGEVLGDAQK